MALKSPSPYKKSFPAQDAPHSSFPLSPRAQPYHAVSSRTYSSMIFVKQACMYRWFSVLSGAHPLIPPQQLLCLLALMQFYLPYSFKLQGRGSDSPQICLFTQTFLILSFLCFCRGWHFTWLTGFSPFSLPSPIKYFTEYKLMYPLLTWGVDGLEFATCWSGYAEIHHSDYQGRIIEQCTKDRKSSSTHVYSDFEKLIADMYKHQILYMGNSEGNN